MVDALAILFNYSWKHAALPLDWKRANVVALYKGNGPRDQPTNYRPISLTSIVVRLLERIILARIFPLLDNSNFFSSAKQVVAGTSILRRRFARFPAQSISFPVSLVPSAPLVSPPFVPLLSPSCSAKCLMAFLSGLLRQRKDGTGSTVSLLLLYVNALASCVRSILTAF
jgi:hypothetical protein